MNAALANHAAIAPSKCFLLRRQPQRSSRSARVLARRSFSKTYAEAFNEDDASRAEVRGRGAQPPLPFPPSPPLLAKFRLDGILRNNPLFVVTRTFSPLEGPQSTKSIHQKTDPILTPRIFLHHYSMWSMFNSAYAFNQPLLGWSVSRVTVMNNMFHMANDFNQPLAHWNVSSVTSMNYMFNGASSFHQDITGWSTPSHTSSSNMFRYATAWLSRYVRNDGTSSKDGPPSSWRRKG